MPGVDPPKLLSKPELSDARMDTHMLPCPYHTYLSPVISTCPARHRVYGSDARAVHALSAAASTTTPVSHVMNEHSISARHPPTRFCDPHTSLTRRMYALSAPPLPFRRASCQASSPLIPAASFPSAGVKQGKVTRAHWDSLIRGVAWSIHESLCRRPRLVHFSASLSWLSLTVFLSFWMTIHVK